MGRKNDGETNSMFPELDKDNAEHKALLKLARDYKRKKQAHAEGIAELKGVRDAAEQKLLMKMHELKLTGFICDGVKVNIETGQEKALIRVDESEDEDEEEEEPSTPPAAAAAKAEKK